MPQNWNLKTPSRARETQICENYQTHTTIVSSNINDVDVFGIISDEAAAYVNYFKIKTVLLFSPTLQKSKNARRNR